MQASIALYENLNKTKSYKLSKSLSVQTNLAFYQQKGRFTFIICIRCLGSIRHCTDRTTRPDMAAKWLSELS